MIDDEVAFPTLVDSDIAANLVPDLSFKGVRHDHELGGIRHGI
jgi:hypothetical protein